MVINGIAGLNLGDGNGGKIALSITERVQRIISDDWFTYMTATVNQPSQITRNGTVFYRKPQILAPTNYESMVSGGAQIPQVGGVSVHIDTQRGVKHEIESFDLSRIENVDALIAQVSAGLALAIRNDLNAQFWLRVHNLFATDQPLNAQQIELEFLGTQQTTITSDINDKLFGEYMKLEYKLNRLQQTYTKNVLGVPKAEVMSITSLDFDTSLKQAFRNQPNSIGEWQVTPTLVGKKIGQFKFITDPMFDLLIPLKNSFNTDYIVKLTNVIGFMFHNEALAFPMNLDLVTSTINPENGNIRFIQKYQFGFGPIWPELVWAIVRKNNRITTVIPTEKVTTPANAQEAKQSKRFFQ